MFYVLRVTYDVPVLKHASANQACLISPALSERGQNGILKASSKCSTHGKKEREHAVEVRQKANYPEEVKIF